MAIKKGTLLSLLVFIMISLPTIVLAQSAEKSAHEKSSPSPWVITPLLSVDPKLSSSIGVLGGYLHSFDPESPSSMFSPFESIQVTSAAAPRPEITHDIICCFPVVMLASPDGVIAKGRY